jgi:hypothetical protein
MVPPKPTLPPELVEQLRAEVEKLLPVGERLHAELLPVGERLRADLAAKRAPPPKVKRSRRALRERVAKVVREEVCPCGVPTRSKANPNWKLLSRLGKALEKRGIHASPDTMLRALGRRRDPKKKPVK